MYVVFKTNRFRLITKPRGVSRTEAAITNLFPALLQALQPQDGVNTLYADAMPLRQHPNIV